MSAKPLSVAERKSLVEKAAKLEGVSIEDIPEGLSDALLRDLAGEPSAPDPELYLSSEDMEESKEYLDASR
jgi:hypothetical protein